MATPTRSEYITIDGLPLTTAAWETEDIATILSGAGTRGNDLVIPTRRGALSRRRTLEAREINIPMVVHGFLDSDGNAHADPREGLMENLDEIKRHLAPKYTTLTGTRTLVWNNGNNIYRTAEVHVSPSIQVSSLGPNAARIIITATIPNGVLRDGSGEGLTVEPVPAATVSVTFSVSNGTSTSTGQIEDAQIVFGGEATWPGPNALTSAPGAPTPGSGSAGDWYYDEDAALVYGPRENGGAWPGPYEVQFFTSGAPDPNNIAKSPYLVFLDPASSYTATEVYGPRTISAPNATNLKIENLTYDPNGGVYIQYDETITGIVIIDCGEYTATEGATSVGGSIVTGGTPLWLPLLPGTNELRLTLATNTADASINIVARAVFL